VAGWKEGTVHGSSLHKGEVLKKPETTQMRTSLKFRRQILDAISAGTMSMLDEFFPFHKDSPPECWNNDEKKLWDLINEQEHRIVTEVNKVVEAGFGTPEATP